MKLAIAAVQHLQEGTPGSTVFGSGVDEDKFHESVSLFSIASGGQSPAHPEGHELCVAALHALGRPIHAETAARLLQQRPAAAAAGAEPPGGDAGAGTRGG